jgi:SWI/SNF-related matrix-associated actin-dependent regulator 1 of chromatin subfamily A
MATNIDDSFNCPAEPVKVQPTREDILGALQFGPAKEVPTKMGPRLKSEAKPSDAFLDLWDREQDSLRALGLTLGRWPKDTGPLKITKWEKIPEKIIVQRQNAQALSRATDADINAPCPEGLSYLGYQRAGIAFGFERDATLIADEMGLGKTIQLIGIINCLPDAKKILIICPASLKLNWKRELEKWLVKPRPIFVADSQMFPDMEGIVIINYDVLHKHEELLHSLAFDLMGVDEAHYLKNKKARRAKMVLGFKPSKKEADKGAVVIPGITAKKRVFLTGTPIANKPAELFPLLSYLDPWTWDNFFRYGIRYCAGHQGSHGWDFSGASNLGELQEKLRSTIMVRRLKKDVLTELPPKRRQVIELPADKETAGAIRREMEAFQGRDDEMDQLQAAVELAKVSDNQDDYRKAVADLQKGMGAALGEISALRRETAVSKIPMVIAHLQEALEESDKVIVFAHHKEVVAAIAAEFGSAAVKLVGDTAMVDRQEAVDRFQKDPTCKLFVGSLMAAGVGITLTASSHVVFAELDWVPGNVSQAEDRAHRIGQKESVLIQHLVLEGSLDAIMAKRIISKQEIIEKALDTVSKAAPDAAPEAMNSRGAAAATAGLPREKLAADAEKMTQDQRDAAVAAIRLLAARCNGAGFSKIDTMIGKSLAAQDRLSPKQAALAAKIAVKYRGQIGEQLTLRIKGLSS